MLTPREYDAEKLQKRYGQYLVLAMKVTDVEAAQATTKVATEAAALQAATNLWSQGSADVNINAAGSKSFSNELKTLEGFKLGILKSILATLPEELH